MRFFRRYAGAVAAVLCAVTIIPAAVYIGKGGSKSYSESAVDGAAVTTETSIEEMVAEAPAEEAALEETFEVTMEAAEASKLRSEEEIRASVKISDGELQVNEAEKEESIAAIFIPKLSKTPFIFESYVL